MNRPELQGVQRFHHLQDIPCEYREVLFTGQLQYSAHARNRFNRRVMTLGGDLERPTHLDARAMQLLASDVADGQVVMQVWRMPLAGVGKDLVLAVSDAGRVATVWVVEPTDEDGIRRPKATGAKPKTSQPKASGPKQGLPVTMTSLKVSMTGLDVTTVLFESGATRRGRSRFGEDQVGLDAVSLVLPDAPPEPA